MLDRAYRRLCRYVNAYDVQQQRSCGSALLAGIERRLEAPSWFLDFCPMAESFFHILNPLFAEELEFAAAKMPGVPFLLRDGFLPLVTYFCHQPRPLSRATLILVHEALIDSVPAAWRNQTLAYRHHCRAVPASLFPRKPFVFAQSIAIESYASVGYKMLRLRALRREFPGSAILLQDIVGSDPFGLSENSQHYVHECSRALAALRHPPLLVRERTFTPPLAARGLVVAELQETPMLLADSFKSHLLASAGARMAGTQRRLVGPEELYVPFSPFHGYVVSRPIFSARSMITIELRNHYSLRKSPALGPGRYAEIRDLGRAELPPTAWNTGPVSL